MSEGFHTTVFPHTSAIAVFQDHTATGKLKAVITPTTPSGCQVSISRWPGRSEGMVRPYSCRDRPTAKSQTSIISCTSPAASERILPASMETRSARSCLCARSSSPRRRTSCPRTGAGVSRHTRRKASSAAVTACSVVLAVPKSSRNSSSPVMGVRAEPGAPPSSGRRAAPHASRAAVARSARSAVSGRVVVNGMRDLSPSRAVGSGRRRRVNTATGRVYPGSRRTSPARRERRRTRPGVAAGM